MSRAEEVIEYVLTNYHGQCMERSIARALKIAMDGMRECFRVYNERECINKTLAAIEKEFER